MRIRHRADPADDVTAKYPGIWLNGYAVTELDCIASSQALAENLENRNIVEEEKVSLVEPFQFAVGQYYFHRCKYPAPVAPLSSPTSTEMDRQR
jgi:hypothetical protein